MLDVLADAHKFSAHVTLATAHGNSDVQIMMEMPFSMRGELPGQAKLFLHCIERPDLCWHAIGAIEIPGIESRKVLEGSEELVAAYCRRDEFEVMGDGRMVDELSRHRESGMPVGSIMLQLVDRNSILQRSSNND